MLDEVFKSLRFTLTDGSYVPGRLSKTQLSIPMKIFLALGAVAAIALPVDAIPTDPDLNCYIVSEVGEVVNLQSLCSGVPSGRIIRTGDIPGVLNRREPANSNTSSGGNVSPSSSDIDCADVSSPVAVGGSDPNRLDGDGDGIGCE